MSISNKKIRLSEMIEVHIKKQKEEVIDLEIIQESLKRTTKKTKPRKIKNIWAKIKEKITIPDIITLENGRCECLRFGNTTTPSCQYNDSEDILYCHKCQNTMDVIQVYAIINNLDKPEAIKELVKQYKIDYGEYDEIYIKTEEEISEIFINFMEKCHKNLLDKELYEFVKNKRDFTDKTMKVFKIGLFDNSIKKYINKTYSKEFLQNAGFLNEKGYWIFGKRIVYPYLDQNNKPKYFIYRLIDSEPDFRKKAKYIKQRKTKYIKEIPFGLNSIYSFKKKPLIITEGITDAISIIQAKYPCLSPVTIRIKKKDIVKMISHCKRFKKVVVINDNEEFKKNKDGDIENSGLIGSIDTIKVLIPNKINSYVGIIPNPEKLEKIDLNDYLRPKKEAIEKLNNLINDSIKGIDFLIDSLNNTEFTTDNIREIITLIPKDDVVERRNIFEKIKDKTKLNKDELMKIEKQIEKEKGKQKSIKKQVQKKLTKEEIKECEEWLKLSDDKRVNDIIDILTFNIVGEEEQNKALLIFFLKLGDIFSKELISFVDFKGESSAGKSYICDNVLKVLPKDKIYIFDSGSDKALHYDEELKGKRFIYIREMKKNLNLIEELKSTFDYNPIIKTVEKDEETGHFITRTIRNEQMGLLTTYSFEFTQRDLINRSWTLVPDQSYKQTKDIIDFQIKKQENKIEEDLIELTINKKGKFIQNALSLLDNNLTPYIAYAKHLEPLFSQKNLRIRRDVSKIYNLIGIITLFNQKNRKTLEIKETGKTYIFSEYKDLCLALKIAKDYFLEITQDLDQLKKDILDFMKFDGIEEEDDKTDEVIYRNYKVRDISDEMSELKKSACDNTIRNKLKSLTYDSFVETFSKGKGKATEYKKLKDYDKLDINLEELKDEIDELVKKEYDYHSNKKN